MDFYPLVLRALVIAICLSGLTAPADAQPASAKSRAKPANPPELKRLDAKVEEVRESFLRDTTKLIKSFEDVGQFERAKVLLEALQKLDPKNEPVKNKLAELNKQILDTSEFEIDIDPGESWQPVGMVAKGKPLRILVSGDYKLLTSITATADGAPSDNPAEDLIPHVPFGAVMAVITNPGAADGPDGNRQNNQRPRPFTVGSEYERPAEQDGLLYLKVNVPPGAKCTGSLEAKISGATKP
ncbi:MAG: hypothetical protein NTW36_10380 [Planctomycetia bacterium]|nr:hypothetical protein [Planctomycetia bacterium]